MSYRVQTISDILSTQIKWNLSNNFVNEPIELLFEVSEVRTYHIILASIISQYNILYIAHHYVKYI